jgi:hypothetical protein
MILFDISSVPEGLNIESWFELLSKYKICLYDSFANADKKPIPPFVVDDKINSEYVTIIDVKTMTDKEIDILNNAIIEMNNERVVQNEEAKMLLRQNNERLVQYLKSINDKSEGIDTDSDK